MQESRHKKSHIIWLHFYETSRIGKSIETESKFSDCQRLEKEVNGKLLMGTECFGVMKMFYNQIVVIITMWIDWKTFNCTLYFLIFFLVLLRYSWQHCLSYTVYWFDLHTPWNVNHKMFSERSLSYISTKLKKKIFPLWWEASGSTFSTSFIYNKK